MKELVLEFCGTADSKLQEIEIVKFKVKDVNKNIFVEGLVIPTICTP